MKTLRLLRNVAALFILGAALLVSRPSVGRADIKNTCLSDSSTFGWNCTFNSNGTCSETKCKSGEPCNNFRCGDEPAFKCPHNCCFCGF